MPDKLEAQPAYRFYVEVNRIVQAVFTEVSGLQIDVDTFEVTEGGNNSFVRKLPGHVRVGDITLKRGMTKSNDLYTWTVDIIHGKIDRRTVSVIMYDVHAKEIARWNFNNAYPIRWVGPSFTSTSNGVAIESLTLTHEGLVVSN